MKLIILDRDGVVNDDSDGCVRGPDDWRALPGSLDAIARLCRAGYRVVVATEQPGVARGLLDLAALGAIHTKMQQAVATAGGRIDAVFFCPHAPDAGCSCARPRPGLLLQILQRFHANPTEVHAIGDELRDLQAAHAAGCRPVLVLTGKGRRTLADGELPADAAVRVDLAAVAAELAP